MSLYWLIFLDDNVCINFYESNLSTAFLQRIGEKNEKINKNGQWERIVSRDVLQIKTLTGFTRFLCLLSLFEDSYLAPRLGRYTY
jgi:hypothetical protein